MEKEERNNPIVNYKRDGRAPIPNKESTSRAMSANKGKSTKPEIAFRKLLFEKGYRGYRVNYQKLPGTPDIVYLKHRIAIFINGCYWHRCPYCNLASPKTHEEFWKDKFLKNIERDRKNYDVLISMGWKVMIIWECEIKNDIINCLDRVILLRNED